MSPRCLSALDACLRWCVLNCLLKTTCFKCECNVHIKDFTISCKEEKRGTFTML